MTNRAMAAAIGLLAARAWGQCEERWDERFPPAPFDYSVPPMAIVGNEHDAMVFASGGRWDIRYENRYGPFYWDGTAWGQGPGGLGVARTKAPTFVHAPDEPGVAYVFAEGMWLTDGELATLARWDGSAWTSLNGGSRPTLVTPGPAADPRHLAWMRWSMQGPEIVERVNEQNVRIGGLHPDYLATALLWYDDGSGPKLYAFGHFQAISQVPFEYAAVWDGQSWSEVGDGPGVALTRAFVVPEDGRSAIYGVGGWQEDTIYRWDGAAWSTMPNDGKRLISVADLGNGSRLIGQQGDRQTGLNWLWEWTGTNWERLPHWVDGEVTQLITIETVGASTTYAGGDFLSINDVAAKNIAKWDGSRWSDIGSAQTSKGIRRAFTPLVVGPEGGALLGNRLYVTSLWGELRAGHQRLGAIASWDGRRWEPTGLRLLSDYQTCRCLLFADLGDGPRLLVGGSFDPNEGGFGPVAQYDGRAWTSIGDPQELQGEVYRLLMYDAGQGPELFAVGRLGGAASHVARFDGQHWQPVGAPPDDWCEDAAVLDDGSGPALYVGGRFTEIGGKSIAALARWDGSEWSQVGPGLTDDDPPAVGTTIPLHMNGRQYLIIRGRFTFDDWNDWAAIWDGQAWIDPKPLMGDAMWFERITTTNSAAGPRVISWFRDSQAWVQDGNQFRLVTEDLDANIWGAAIGTIGGVESLYLVGDFTEVDGIPSDGFARYGCPQCPADFDADGDADEADFVEFMGLWEIGDPAADLDLDGYTDTRDVIGFLNFWSEGC